MSTINQKWVEQRKNLKPELFKSVIIVPDNSNIEKLKAGTETIQLNCDFNSDGLCKKYQPDKHTPVGKNIRHEEFCTNDIGIVVGSCCTNCATTIGYFTGVRENRPNTGTAEVMTQEQINFLKRRYSAYTGYWRKGVGCIIPRKWRSIVCLTFYCQFTKNKKSIKKLDELRHQLWAEYAEINKEHGK